MPFLKQQVEIINAELRERSLKDARFQPGRFEALAVEVSRVNEEKIESFPAIMSSNYEAQPITVDDTYPIIIYHKVMAKGPGRIIPTAQYGDGNGWKGEVAEMKMVVYGKYAKLRLTQEELEALITVNFPDSIAKSKLANLKLDSMTATWQSSNLNAAQVFQEEYKGFELFLAPEDILFSVRYSIESKFRKGCFTICDCASGVT